MSAASVGASAGDNATTFARDRDAVRAIQAVLRGPEQALVFTSGSAVFGVFNGGAGTDVAYDEDSRVPQVHETFASEHPISFPGLRPPVAGENVEDAAVPCRTGDRCPPNAAPPMVPVSP
ncbi:MAG: hypothetical protein ACLP8S_20660 [Solirubrobacteraceae bacterium]